MAVLTSGSTCLESQHLGESRIQGMLNCSTLEGSLNYVRSWPKNWGRRNGWMGQQWWAPDILSVPSTHLGQLTTTCSGWFDAFFWSLWAPALMCACVHTHIYTQIKIDQISFFLNRFSLLEYRESFFFLALSLNWCITFYKYFQITLSWFVACSWSLCYC